MLNEHRSVLPSLCIPRELGAYERHNDLADPGTQKVWG